MAAKKSTLSLLLIIVLIFTLIGCGKTKEPAPEEPATEDSAAPEVEKNGEIYILYTNDVHCGIDQGFGYAGLWQIRERLKAQGYETLLVDNGDSIQGNTLGMLTQGGGMMELMNAMQYDVAIPGNHEFDYGVDRFLELTKQADFPYICCNFSHDGELLFPPYVIIECAGIKIGFVGVTTPKTLTSSTPKFFQNEVGEFIYDFCADEDGQELFSTVQDAVDQVRAEGVDLVVLMGHMGMVAKDIPWTYADLLAATNGIDIMLDGHSHDTEQVEMLNKDGETVIRSSAGTKLSCVGYCHISAEGQILETGIWSWPNKASAPEVLGIRNEMSDKVDAASQAVKDELSSVVAVSTVDLTIFDPNAVDDSGNPIRMVRRAETNMGDLCADALRCTAEADIAVIGGGAVRKDIVKGDVTYLDIFDVFPFGNQVAVIRVTGQQILDALEWGAHALPNEFGGFLHVSGLTYEIDVSVPSGCISDESGLLAGIEGERRVRNVYVGDAPLDPDAYYTVAGNDYTLLSNGDGTTAFDGAEVISDSLMIDNEALSDYIINELHGEIGGEYADPYGQGRITIIDSDSLS